ncbi:MAG: hypothetical protein Q3M24_02935 [Candidatus Electrothrix aestuarii]|uniref:Uncharacterized protein n=1 Tax=Candidatus Electrothrix aestuarii TaxID=3062594 RepID=A0AAU8LXY6_9BACT
MVTYSVNPVKFLHQVREEVHVCCLMRKSFCTVPVSVNATRLDSDRDFLIIADHPLDREIITKLKDGQHYTEQAGMVFA